MIEVNNQIINDYEFSLSKYFELLDKSIQSILSRHENDILRDVQFGFD